MSKTAISWFYFPCLLIELLFLVVVVIPAIQEYNDLLQRVAQERSQLQADQSSYGSQSEQVGQDQGSLAGDQVDLPRSQDAITSDIEVMAVVSLLGTIAWIGTLINLARAQLWIWFALTFLFGGILILIYLVAGPKPLKAGQVAQTTTNHAPGVQPPAHQQPSALEVLQLRFARGEIDAATFHQMSEQLRSSERR